MKKKHMKGWKTWTAAGVSVAYGIGGFLAGLHDQAVMMSFVIGGLGMIGLGHKLDKVRKD